jgi:tricorn protease
MDLPAMRLSFVLALLAALAPPAAAGNVHLPRFPSISPDGTSIVFSHHGDLWLVEATGGAARRLTSNPADELESAWSPDGEHIAFTSTRTGARNIYLMNSDGTGVRAVTDIDRDCSLAGFGVDADGETVLTFHAVLEGDVYRDWRPYMVGLDGGAPRRVHDAFGSSPAVARDGRRVAFVRGGYYARRGRRHYRGPESSDVWLHDRNGGSFTRLTTWPGNDAHVRWGGDRTLLFLSDRELSCVNLYRMSADDGEQTSARLTEFSEHDIHGFDVTPDGGRAVLAAWDTLYTLDLNDANARPRPIEIVAAEDARDDYALRSIGTDVSEAALSPDGEVMAVVAYGEIYVRNVAEESPTRRVTRSHARESGIAWSPDGLRLYFTSDRDGTESIYAARVERTRDELKEQFEERTGIDAGVPGAGEADGEEDGEAEADDDNGDEDTDETPDESEATDEEAEELDPRLDPERWHDAMTFSIEPVVQRETNDRSPRPSPDGTRLAFRSTRGNLEILDLGSGAITRLLEHWDAWMDWRWSPDGRYVAYAQSDLDFNSDIFIVPADGSTTPVNITRHPDIDLNPRFSADGRVLVFTSDRVNDTNDVWMVHLDRDLDALSAADRRAYYEAAAKAAEGREPLDPSPEDDEDDGDEQSEPAFGPADLEDAYRRVRRVTRLVGEEQNVEITPGGDRIIFTASGDTPGVHSIKWDGTEQTKLAENGSIAHVSLTGDRVVLVTGSRAATVGPDGSELKHIDVADRMRIDLAEQASQKFIEAARGLGEGFYSPTMNGVDWDRLAGQYHDLAVHTRTVEEFNWIANRFIGELNGSHLAVRGGGTPPENVQAFGRLGTSHRRVAGGFEITAVVPHGPAADGPMALRAGDVITAVEFDPFADTDTVEMRLKDRVGKETTLSIRRALADGTTVDVDVLVTPTSYRGESQLRYEAWRRRNADLVAEWSGGRIGYIHIQSMGQAALDVFERDLFAAADGRDALLVDVRNNGGGWTTDRVLSSIMVREHAFTVPRGADPEVRGHYPQPRLYIQRYVRPVNMLCNEKSFSNAEIISHAFKTLERGTLVGQQTYGGVISTGGWSLIDGTWVRLPFRGWFVADGTNRDMELSGAMPNIVVEQTPEDEVAGVDAQLRAAVDDLMTRLE